MSYSTTAPYLAPKPALPPTAPPQQTGVLDWSLLAWRSFTGEQSPEVVNWQQSNRQKFPNAAEFFDSIVHSQPQRVVNAFAEQFVAMAIDRPIMFLSEEAARVKLGAQTQTAQFAVQAKQTVSEIKDFVQAEIARIITGETTETALFFEKIGNFVEADFNRLRNGQATVIGSALAADFTALANMTPEELAAYLGHEAGDAFLLFIAGGGVHYGGRAMSKAMETVHAVGRKFIATHTFQPPLVFQFSGNKLYTGFPIDVVKPQKIIKRKHVTEFAVGEADLVQAEYLRRSLELQQIFTADGKLTQAALSRAKGIKDVSEFNKVAPIYKEIVAKGDIENWKKYALEFELGMQHTYNGELMPLKGEVHFYMNKATMEVFYERDYKIKLQLPYQPTISVDELLAAAFKGAEFNYDCKM